MFLAKINTVKKTFGEIILGGYEIKCMLAKIISCIHDEYQCCYAYYITAFPELNATTLSFSDQKFNK